MYMRGVRATFTNDMMKNSVLAFMEQHAPGDRMISFVAHIWEIKYSAWYCTPTKRSLTKVWLRLSRSLTR